MKTTRDISSLLTQCVYKYVYSFDKDIEAVEIRLDKFPLIDISELKTYIKNINLPVIFTLRRKLFKGSYEGNKQQFEALILKLCALQPDYIDIDHRSSKQLYNKIKKVSKDTQVIVSYHNFSQTPNLEKVYTFLKKRDADIYKLASYCKNAIDAFKHLLFCLNNKDVAIAPMGERGSFARILSKIYGSKFIYTVDKDPLYNQLTIQELKNIYLLHEKDRHTKVYALIGDPITSSLSHICHNQVFKRLCANAIYVKIPIQTQELKKALFYTSKLGFLGLSVTMPLKQRAYQLTRPDAYALKLRSINTICMQGNLSYNTDAIAAIAAIEKRSKIFGKKILILGAGGTSRSICFQLKDKGANVYIYNRTFSKAKNLAKHLQARALPDLQNLHEDDYDILINATSVGMDENSLPISKHLIFPNKIVFDVISYPKWTPLLKIAYQQQCQCIFGYEMFASQAAHQFLLWNIQN